MFDSEAFTLKKPIFYSKHFNRCIFTEIDIEYIAVLVYEYKKSF